MKYLHNLQQKYLKPSAPWWAWVVLLPILMLMDAERAMNRKLQQIFKPIVAAARFIQAIYREIFPDNAVGAWMELMWLAAIVAAVAIETIAW